MLISIIRPVPQTAVDFVAQHEGLRLTAYPDPASGGVPWTIGYGHASGVVQGMTITDDQAKAMLRSDLEHWARQLEATVGENCITALTDNQYAALLSFCFNLGIHPTDKIWAMLKAQNFDAVPVKMQEYVFAGGRQMAGLVRRRSDERILWSTGEPGSTAENPPSSVTRAMDTPPVDPVVKPLNRSKSFMTGIATVGATSLAAAQDGIKGVKDAVTPYVADSAVLQGLMSHMALVAAGLAVATTGFLWLKNREAKAS